MGITSSLEQAIAPDFKGQPTADATIGTSTILFFHASVQGWEFHLNLVSVDADGIGC